MMVDLHPLLDAGLLRTEFSKTLKAFGPDERVLGLLKVGAVAPVTADDAVRGHVRDLLRHGGYKPTPETTQTRSIIWGTTALPGKTAATLAWYRQLLERTGATVTEGDKSS